MKTDIFLQSMPIRTQIEFYFNYILQIYYRKHQQIILFDQKGEKIDKFPLKEIHNVTSSANPCHLHIMGDNLLYINDDKR